MTSILHPVYFSIFPQKAIVTSRAHGIDISKYDLFFLPETAISQLDFVIQRISYRLTRDEAFDTLLPGVMHVPIRGGYHYLNSDKSWREQADNFLSYVDDYKYHFFACDFEGAFNILSTDFAYAAWQWIHYVQGRTGKPVLLYTSPSLYSQYIHPSQARFGIDWNTVDWWSAQWFFLPNPDGAPTMPSGRAGWKIWQYTDKGDGTQYGVARPTACDLDVYNGSVGELKEWLKIEDGTIPPEEPMTKYYRLDTTAVNIRVGPGASYQDVGDLVKRDVVQLTGSPIGGWAPYKVAQHADGTPVKLINGVVLDISNTQTFWSTNAYFVEVAGLPNPTEPPPPVVDEYILYVKDGVSRKFIPE